MVAYDPDNLGPDNVQWYEIQGSAHVDPTKEPWYEMAKVNGNDVNIYFDYRITYYRPDSEPTSRDEWDTYIKWEDNQGNSGYKMKNQYHSQPYYPLWAGNTLSFTGTCLPQNAIDESGSGTYFVLYKFRYGYADNEINSYDDSSIDISWAVDASGNSVNLPGVDYIKIYTGVNQENGWLWGMFDRNNGCGRPAFAQRGNTHKAIKTEITGNSSFLNFENSFRFTNS